MNFRLIAGIILLFALPLLGWYIIDKGFLIYIYSLMGDVVLGLYLIITGLEKGEDK